MGRRRWGGGEKNIKIWGLRKDGGVGMWGWRLGWGHGDRKGWGWRGRGDGGEMGMETGGDGG